MVIKELLLLRENANLSGGSAIFRSIIAERHSLSACYLLRIVMLMLPKVPDQWNGAGCSDDMPFWPMSPLWSGVPGAGRATRGPKITLVQMRERPKQNKTRLSPEVAVPRWAHGWLGKQAVGWTSSLIYAFPDVLSVGKTCASCMQHHWIWVFHSSSIWAGPRNLPQL